MFTEEQKKQKNYGSIFVYCFCCFFLVVEVARFAKPFYNNLQNLMDIEAAVVEEGFFDVEENSVSGRPCQFLKSRSARNDKKLSIPIRQEIRAHPPTSYCVKFQSFATMSNLVKSNGDMYESKPFSAGGYNWTLLIYPNANKPVGSGGYVSLYVKIDNSSLISNPGDVYAEITFLTYKATIDKYHLIKETDAQRFHLFKQQFGQLNFLEIAYYQNPAHGFIFDGGQSVFGVDILVTPPFKQWEVASYENNIRDPIFTWKLTKFSIRNLDSYTSDSFSSGGSNWKLKVYPNGASTAAGNSLSLYLISEPKGKGYVKAKLRVYDQIRSTYVEKQVDGWPDEVEIGWGSDKFMPLSDLKDTSKGFLVDDALKVEVEILSFSNSQSFSN